MTPDAFRRHLAQFGQFIAIDELGYPPAEPRDCVQLASTINREAGLIVLARYNLALAIGAMKSANSRDFSQRYRAQEAVLRNSVSVARLRELQNKLGNASLVTRPVFHRSQLATMLKLVAKFGQSVHGNRLRVRDDFDVLCELGLLVNSLWAQLPVAVDAGRAIAPSLAANVEIENPPPVPESLVRASQMLGEHLDILRVHSGFARRLERTFVLSTGMNFEELLDLTFAVWAYYNSLTVEQLVENQSAAHLNPYQASDALTGDYFARILRAGAVDFAGVPGMPFGPADHPGFLHDHTTLRARPIWRFAHDNYMCFDPAFLQEKLSSGLFWTVMDGLDDADRLEFSRLWGRLFERYVNAALESVFSSARVLRSPRYDDGNEAFDFVLDYGDRLIVGQVKGTFIPVQAKYSARPEEFFDGMESRFGDGDGGALRQLRENIRKCFGLNSGHIPIAELSRRRFRELLPVVVHQEPILEFGLATRYFAKRFEGQLREILWRLDLVVRPVVFLHVNDLHMVAEYIREGRTTLVDALHGKLDSDRGHLLSFEEFWKREFRRTISSASLADSVLSAKWTEYREASLQRFREGRYVG